MNAKQELQEELEGKSKIKCAEIKYNNAPWGTKYTLHVNHSEEQLTDFLTSLDFSYDNGYGGQELYGTVWLEDGTWLSRGEYDGSEWWQHNKVPEIPEHLYKV